MNLISAATSLVAGTLVAGLASQALGEVPYAPWSISALASAVALTVASFMLRSPSSSPNTSVPSSNEGPRETGTVKWGTSGVWGDANQSAAWVQIAQRRELI